MTARTAIVAYLRLLMSPAMPADATQPRTVSMGRSAAGFRGGFASRRPHRIASLIGALLIAFAVSGCGDDKQASSESLPDRPKLTVPDGSVEPAESKSSDSTGETGSSDTGTSTGTDTTTDSGGAGTDTTDQTTGGQGTDQTTTTAPQDTGGAAPGE